MVNKNINELQENREVTLEEVQATQKQLIRELNRLKKVQARVKRRTTLLVAVIAVLILITGTLAWFTLNSKASVDNIALEITTGVDLRVDVDNHGSDVKAYKKIITNEMVNKYLATAGGTVTSLKDMRLDPVTSSTGKPDFTFEKGSVAKANSDTYLEYKVWFIATKDMWVHLNSNTETVEGTTTGTTAVKTSETDIKADVVKAVRISFDSPDATKIYEPNKGTPVNGQTTFDLPTPMAFSNDTRLFHLTKEEPKQVTIRLWAEGNDPECDDDVQNANIQLAMLFTGTDDNNVPMDNH